MRYFIPFFVLAFFAVDCLGVTPGQPISTNSVSTNLLKAIKASPIPPAKWDGSFSMGLTATAGNVNSVLTTAKIIAQKKGTGNQWNLGADGVYGQADSIKTSASAHGYAQLNHIFVDDTWYGYGREDALHDEIADVAYRITSGAGAGYYFVKNKVTTFSGEAGPAVQMEQLDDEYHNYPSGRLAENFEHKIDDHAKVWENIEVLPPLTAPDAFLVNAEVGLETPLTHKLSLQTYVQDNFANQPAPGFKNNDLKLVSGLVLKF